jgi:hypothetical protein
VLPFKPVNVVLQPAFQVGCSVFWWFSGKWDPWCCCAQDLLAFF